MARERERLRERERVRERQRYRDTERYRDKDDVYHFLRWGRLDDIPPGHTLR